MSLSVRRILIQNNDITNSQIINGGIEYFNKQIGIYRFHANLSVGADAHIGPAVQFDCFHLVLANSLYFLRADVGIGPYDQIDLIDKRNLYRRSVTERCPMVYRFAPSLRTHCHRALPGKLKFVNKERTFRKRACFFLEA